MQNALGTSGGTATAEEAAAQWRKEMLPNVAYRWGLPSPVEDENDAMGSATAPSTPQSPRGNNNNHAVVNKEKTTMTSIRLFRKFLSYGEDGSVDASRIHSRECYEAWLASRKKKSSDPEKSFQRTLSSHLTSVDGRVPFTKEEEAAILAVLRQRQRWPCFAHCTIRFGQTGFRALGFHEKQLLEEKKSKTTSINDVERAGLLGLSTQATKQSRLSTQAVSVDGRKRVKHLPEDEHRKKDIDDSENQCREDSFSSPKSVKKYSVLECRTPSPTLLLGREEPPFRQAESDDSDNSDVVVKPITAIEQDPPKIEGTKFLRAVYSLFENISSLSLETWHQVIAIGRLFLFTFGWFNSPTINDAQQIMDSVSRDYPDNIILLMDLTCQNMRDKFILQNDISRAVFGPITRADGGFEGKLVIRDDLWATLTTVVAACRYPGEERSVKYHEWNQVEGGITWHSCIQ